MTNKTNTIKRDSIRYCKVCNLRMPWFYNYKTKRRECMGSLDNKKEELKHKEVIEE